MKRTILRALLALATGLAGVTVAASSVTAGDARGPGCSDFSGQGNFFYTATDVAGEAIVEISFDVASPSCSDWSYNLHVLDETGQRELVKSSIPGNGSGRLTIRASVPGDPVLPPKKVCIYTTTTKGARVSDVAPDDGCAPVEIGTIGGPGQNWQ